ncbi:MAG: efflux RND transporter periplasmic adaptor subunit [Bryobacterales bacterium]|nr:efflux RND transporter periplasmic adaptor subunit [Bryobacterales bacterium]
MQFATTREAREATGGLGGAGRCSALALCGGAVLAALGAACAPEEPKPPQEPQPRPVKHIEVIAQGGVRTRTFTGFAKADVRAEFGFRVSGTVRRVHVDEGDLAAEGDLIAELDPVDFEIRLREGEASLTEAKAQAVLADSEFRRAQQLYERDNVSQGEFDSALAKRESAQTRVQSVEQQLQHAKQQVKYTQLRVPTGCRIVAVKVEEGESVQAGAPVVEIVTGENPQVEIAVPELVIADISPGKLARVRFSAVARRNFLGRVKTVGVVPAQGLTTYPVTIELDQSWEQLVGRSGLIPIRPGMAVETQMQFGSDGDHMRHVVPSNAVLADGGGKFVYVVAAGDTGAGTARRRSVETGRLVAEGIEVIQGLVDGDKVITAGLNQIRDGQPVRLLAQN